MLKFLIILFLIVYIVSKLFGSVFGFLFSQSGKRGGAFKQHSRNNHYQNQPKDGNVRVDYVPEKRQKRVKKQGNTGEYVDFEEID
ncbi:MAG: DUF4834 family protein [Bacteroidota bacterium]